MKLYLLRHSHAIDHGIKEDEFRELTDEGITTAKQAATLFARLHDAPLVIYTSSRLRALQTAEIFAEKQSNAKLTVTEECNYGFDINAVKRLISLPHEGAVMFVGHEPFLSATLKEMIGGGNYRIKKCGLARVDVLSHEPFVSELIWFLAPKVFGECN